MILNKVLFPLSFHVFHYKYITLGEFYSTHIRSDTGYFSVDREALDNAHHDEVLRPHSLHVLLFIPWILRKWRARVPTPDFNRTGSHDWLLHDIRFWANNFCFPCYSLCQTTSGEAAFQGSTTQNSDSFLSFFLIGLFHQLWLWFFGKWMSRWYVRSLWNKEIIRAKLKLYWKDPEPVDEWDDVLDASQEGPICNQFNYFAKSIAGTEDCLKLNVYTHDVSFSFFLLKKCLLL